MLWNRMQELILLFSMLQSSLISDALLKGTFLSLLQLQAKAISSHHQ